MKPESVTPVPRDQWEWFGSAAHFICADCCRFHMATKVGDFIVSTVGDYHSVSSQARYGERSKRETIGLNRFYETMVFRAGAPCIESGCNCGLPSIAGDELDMEGYNERGDAQRGHYAMCEKWAAGTPAQHDEKGGEQ